MRAIRNVQELIVQSPVSALPLTCITNAFRLQSLSPRVAVEIHGMQNVVFDEPYEFVPPYQGRFWFKLFGTFLPQLMRSRYGVSGWKTHGLEHLRDSIQAGHGIILCPNHSRISDPMLSGAVTIETPCYVYAMASWHVFKQSRLETMICRGLGAFSVYREGLDRKALDLATDIVATAVRPLVIFPEGVISAANDRLMPFMDGVSFVARAAAKRRAKKVADGTVVVHPVTYKYHHRADPGVALPPVLCRLERQVFWRTNDELSVRQRIDLLRDAVMAAREVQILGKSVAGNVEQRCASLADHILCRYENEWLGRMRSGDVVSRVKDLRSTIIPEMTAEGMDTTERERRWKQLTDLYYAQCMSLHVPGYIDEDLAGDRYHHRLIETVERLEEELTDKFTTPSDLHVDISIGEAITVDPAARRARNGDNLTATLRSRMLEMMEIEDRWPLEPVRDREQDK